MSSTVPPARERKGPTKSPDGKNGWLAPLSISLYHVIIFIVGSCILIGIVTDDEPPKGWDLKSHKSPVTIVTGDIQGIDILGMVFVCGILGATLTASRYVVRAVRRQEYDVYRILWQVLTPLHGGILALIALFVVYGGIMFMGAEPSDADRTVIFLGALSFLVGFAAETFVKALIRAATGLFNEPDDFNGKEEFGMTTGRSRGKNEEGSDS